MCENYIELKNMNITIGLHFAITIKYKMFKGKLIKRKLKMHIFYSTRNILRLLKNIQWNLDNLNLYKSNF